MESRWQRQRKIFEHASRLSGEERAAYLDEACAADAELRRQVDSLLEHDVDTDSFVHVIRSQIDSLRGRLRTGEDANPPLESLVPGILLGDRYRIEGLLGRGGVGEVWRAFDVKLGVEVALKAVHRDLSNEHGWELLRQEVRAAREVHHSNVCRIYDLIETSGRELVSMEHIDGRTLLDVMRESAPLALGEAAGIGRQLLHGLQAIHEAGVVHRDLKPENVMLTRDGVVRIMDFGIARPSGRVDSAGGTPAYMSPEQARSERVDARSDLYSAAVILTELIHPIGARSRETREVVWRGVRAQPRELPAGPWQPVLERALRDDPAERFASAREMWKALREALPEEIAEEVPTERLGRSGAPTEAPPAPRNTRRRVLFALAGVAGLVFAAWLARPLLADVVMNAIGLAGPPVNPAPPARPSVVVLPFVNLSGDETQNYFADGITDDLTTELSRTTQLFVISRSSAFTYKDRAMKVEDIGRELGVRYLVEGSVRRDHDQLRIAAKLIDANSGFHIWSARFDREVADVFAVQAEIAQRIREHLKVEISAAELDRIRGKHSENLNAHDAVMRARHLLNHLRREQVFEARGVIERAIELDPDYALAHAYLGVSYAAEYQLGWDLDPSLLETAREHALRALEINPSEAYAHGLLGSITFSQGRTDEAIVHFERAIELEPNYEFGHAFLGAAHATRGEIGPAIGAMKQALRLNPRGPSATGMLLGFINYAIGRTDEAVEIWERLIDESPDNLLARISLAWQYEKRGDHDLAEEMVREILRVNPNIRADTRLIPSGDFFDEEARQRNIEILRQAGLP